MKLFELLNTPFPRPSKSKKNFLWVLLVGLSASFFILLFKPFGIQNETEFWYVDVIIFSLGIVFMIAILFIEWFVPSLFPRLFNNWTLGKALIWYPFVILFLGAINFLYKSYWGGFNDFNWNDYLLVLARTLSIGITVSFFVLGIWQYLNRKRIYSLSKKEIYRITSQNGKPLSLNLIDVLYISSDDNYVDIHYESNGLRKKAVLRSSLKNIESQIVNPFSPIFRCHRRYLVNLERFSIQEMNSRKMTITLKKYLDKVPVSKRYANITKQRLQIHP